MPLLPIELWITVIQHNYYKMDGSIDIPTLLSCALVHPKWTEPAQSLLFHSIPLDKIVKSKRDDCFFESVMIHGSKFGSYIRRLIVSIGRYPSSADGSIAIHRFTLLLKFLPRLYEVTLNVYGVHQFDGPSIDELGIAAPHIRSLNLLRFGVQSPILYQLIDLWPNIQFLTIGAEIIASPPSDPPKIKLYELMLLRSLIPPASLEWLLSESENTLKVFELRDLPGQQMKSILAKHGPHLRSLRLLHYNKDSADLLRLCTQLEEFVIYRIPDVVHIQTLPTTIEHFSIRNSGTGNKSYKAEIISLMGKLPKLRVVTCDARAVDHYGFTALKNACDAKGAELQFRSWPWWIVSFFFLSIMYERKLLIKLKNEDPVMVKKFPRLRSVSNFKLMN